MRKISIILLLVIFILGSSTSCRKKAFVVDGLAPIYISPLDFSYIKRSSPRTLKNIGQSLQYNNYLFINEIYNGIHVFDNTDPKAPKPIHFWEIPGNLDLSIKDLAELIKKTIGFNGDLNFNAGKPDGTMKKLTDVNKLNKLGWKHKIELKEGVKKLYYWYSSSL